MISSKQQNLIIDITSRFNPRMIGIFGSYARGENERNSDLDILIWPGTTPHSSAIYNLLYRSGYMTEAMHDDLQYGWRGYDGGGRKYNQLHSDDEIQAYKDSIPVKLTGEGGTNE